MDNAFIAQHFKWDCRAPRRAHRLVNRLLRKLVNAQLVPASFRWENANVEARMNVWHLISQTCAYRVPGDVAEIGCNSGETSVVLRTVLDGAGADKELHVYDSFAGLPALGEADRADGVYQPGNMAASEERLRQRFAELGLRLPEIHRGWFEDTIPAQLPDTLSFVVVDGDIYSSTRHVLPHVYQRLSPGGICWFGIYYDETIFRRDDTPGCFKSPGVKRATDEFFADKPESVSVLYANEYSNGYFRKL